MSIYSTSSNICIISFCMRICTIRHRQTTFSMTKWSIRYSLTTFSMWSKSIYNTIYIFRCIFIIVMHYTMNICLISFCMRIWCICYCNISFCMWKISSSICSISFCMRIWSKCITYSTFCSRISSSSYIVVYVIENFTISNCTRIYITIRHTFMPYCSMIYIKN